MNTLRLGIIGMGNVGRFHAGYIRNGKMSRCVLTSICSSQRSNLAAAPGVKLFENPMQLIQSGAVDAVLIATPHPDHPAAGIAAFEAGLHVMSEKPIAAHKADAERFLAAHEQRSGCVFAVMLQFRAQPHYHTMRQLIQTGRLGKIVRVSWINTDWFRPEAYYASNAWRATWRGEGGGVLINQSLHNLDMLQWLVGMPSKVTGFCKFGRFHDIEVEDDVTAYFEWSNGATGTFVSSTGEAPGSNRLEISGTLGRLLLEKDRLIFTQNERDMEEFARAESDPFRKLGAHDAEIVLERVENPHAVLLQNFVNAILDGEELIAPGAEGLHSLELANAIVLSSLQGRTIELPFTGAIWEKKLNELILSSKRPPRKIRTTEADVSASFNR